MLTKDETQNTVDGFLMFTIYAFKNPLMILTDANTKWCIVMNNAFYGLNLPKLLKSNVSQIKKTVFLGACKVQNSA